jgi:hypothetical protein
LPRNRGRLAMKVLVNFAMSPQYPKGRSQLKRCAELITGKYVAVRLNVEPAMHVKTIGWWRYVGGRAGIGLAPEQA